MLKPRWVIQTYETNWYDDWVCCGKPVASSLTKFGIALKWWLRHDETYEGMQLQRYQEYCADKTCRGY